MASFVHRPASLLVSAILSATLPSMVPAAAGLAPSPATAAVSSGATNATPAPRPAVIPILEQLVAQRRDIEENARSLRKEIEKTPAGLHRENLQQELDKLNARLASTDTDLNSLATGIDPSTFTGAASEAFNLQEEVIELVRPLIEQLRRLSEQPREEEGLRTAIEKARARVALTQRAAANTTALLADKSLAPETRAALQRVHRDWQSRLKATQSQLDVLEFQLRQLIERKRPVIESLTSMARTFFRVRGRNLLLTLIAAIAAFVLVRWLHDRARRSSPPLARHDSLYSRIANLLMHILSIAAALIAAMLVLYFAGDWVLLGLLIVILLGLGLAARTGISRFINEIRILLNLGSVREGERVVIDGFPWRVDQINFLTLLSNPALPGHLLRLPLWKLPNLVSRPCTDDEPWFPCAFGDWVLLNDGAHGKVVALGPEFVELVLVGGLHKTYPTPAFLNLCPANLSAGFRVSSTFGIDYNHQAGSTAEIPRLLHDHIYLRLVETHGRDAIRSLKVEFKLAGPSSLDFEILADFDGGVAEKYECLRRSLQCFAVEGANQHGWTIPFTQVMIHQPAGPQAPVIQP